MRHKKALIYFPFYRVAFSSLLLELVVRYAAVTGNLVSRSHTNYAPAAYRCSDYKRAYNRNIDKWLARNWYGYARLLETKVNIV